MSTSTPIVSGMGPIPLSPSGVAFRVWAPHATSVSVIGDFNDWNADLDVMTREDHGCWYTVVENANPGSTYKYEITNGSTKYKRIDPRVREVSNSIGHGIVHDPDFDWQNDDFQMPPWNELVIYETHIGTFNRKNPQTIGTFGDYREQFHHLKRLGVNALKVMPVAEFAGDQSWGYNPAHPYAVESAYGGIHGFKTFVREAHKAGLAVILDVVYNHFGPSDLDMWQFDGWSENGKGGIYFYNDHRSSTPWGDTRPDYGRGEVRSYLRDNAMMWLEDYHVDGLRFDMTLFIRSVNFTGHPSIPEGWSLLQWINREIHEFKPSAITIAEDLQNDDFVTKSPNHGGAGFSSQWDAKFVHPIRDVLIQVDDRSRDMEKVRNALLHHYSGDWIQRVVYTESHDEVANGKSRIPSEVDAQDTDAWHAQKRSTLGLALVLTAPGIPMLFQGQEFLEDGWFRDHEELDWSQAEAHSGIVCLTARLVSLRLNREGVSRGLTGRHTDVFHVNQSDKVVAFRRWYESDDCVVIANFANRHFDHYEIGLPASGIWKRRFSSDRKKWSTDFGGNASGDIVSDDRGYDGLPCRGKFSVPPYTALIYSQD